MNSKSQGALVSVITPTYNRSPLLARAISSVLKQSYQNLEMIIVDDGSTDDTEKLVRSFKDSRVRYEKLDTNKGAPAARNRGLKLAKGEYISFLDSDDEYLDEKLELQLKRILELPRDVGVVYCGYYVLYDDNNIRWNVIPEFSGNIFEVLLKHNCLGSPTPLIKKECFDSCGIFDESLPSCQDWDMWLRISEKYKFDYVDKTLAKAYIHGNQISTNMEKKIIAREILIEKYRSALCKYPKARSFLLKRLGFLHYLDNNHSLSFKYYLRSIQANPIDLDNYLVLLTSLISQNIHMRKMKERSICDENNITTYF